MMLVSTFLAAAAALGFGPGVASLMGADTPFRYTLIVVLTALVSCGLFRALLVPMNEDIDFHPVVDRVGGALTGMACGALAMGFICVVLLCLRWSWLGGAEGSLRRGAALVMAPCSAAARLTPGEYPLELQLVVDGQRPAPEAGSPQG
jgi:hypothetical protein